MEKLIYPILWSEDPKRSEFTTSAGITYSCYFVSAEAIFNDYLDVAGNIYAFNLDVESGNNREKSIDEKIGLTVITVIKKFLLENQTAVVYLCDMSDGREAFRKRKFDSWFKKSEASNIVKLDREIKVRDVIIFNSLMISESNPLFNRIISVFEDFNKRIGSK